MTNKTVDCDVAIIGAGPSGSIAACLLRQQGYSVTLIERERFPRFVIGESLLPQSLETLKKAGCLDSVQAHGFQLKTGATFKCGQQYADIVFADKFSSGSSTAFHVERASFDKLLADCAVEQGAKLYYQHRVTDVCATLNDCRMELVDDKGDKQTLTSRFILDASGYGRVLPRLFGLDCPSRLPSRGSLFTHITDHIPADSAHKRETTLITVHPTQKDVWFWLISFANGRSSVGAVGNLAYLKPYQDSGLAGLQALIAEDKPLQAILAQAEFDTPVQVITSYSASVSQLYGDGYALLGNAAEFLDPVFSSGVTVAMYSADLAAQAVDKTLSGKVVNWKTDYVDSLMQGVDVFRHYVEAWYNENLQKVIFSQGKNASVTAMIASILAGYAWDESNPFVKEVKKLDTVVALCE